MAQTPRPQVSLPPVSRPPPLWPPAAAPEDTSTRRLLRDCFAPEPGPPSPARGSPQDRGRSPDSPAQAPHCVLTASQMGEKQKRVASSSANTPPPPPGLDPVWPGSYGLFWTQRWQRKAVLGHTGGRGKLSGIWEPQATPDTAPGGIGWLPGGGDIPTKQKDLTKVDSWQGYIHMLVCTCA